MMTSLTSQTRKLAAAVLTVVLVASACTSDAENVAILEGGSIVVEGETTLPEPQLTGEEIDFRFDQFGGGTAPFSTLTDKPVVINFFASWCPTCIAEMPDFEAAYQDVKGDVEFLGLATQDREANASDLVDETGVSYPVGLDGEGRIFALFEALGMPTTVFINADGTVARVHTGVLDQAGLTEMINTELLS